MGDRYELGGLKCGHCGKEQEEVYYAASSGFLTHKCRDCKKENIISQGFHLIPCTSEEAEQHHKDNGFE